MLALSKRPKKCAAGCGAKFTPSSALPRCCSFACSAALALQKVEQARQRADRKAIVERRQASRERKAAIRALDEEKVSHWIAKCEKACHRVVHLRDYYEGCISCGTRKNIRYDAGHFRPKSTYSAVRFDLANIHKQCAMNCNKSKSGNYHEYRPRLIQKIGLAEVERLEAAKAPRTYTIPELKALIESFKSMERDLRDQIEFKEAA